MDGFAALAVKQENFECAAKLAGAAAHMRESLGYKTEPAECSFRDNYLARLHRLIDEQTFSKYHEQGRKLKMEEAVKLALNELTHLTRQLKRDLIIHAPLLFFLIWSLFFDFLLKNRYFPVVKEKIINEK